jgi:hypothetical protein
VSTPPILSTNIKECIPVGLVDEFENRLEKLVEGFFSRAFKSKIQPAEIARRLLRAQEGGKTISVERTYVPNIYSIQLSQEDLERFSGLADKLEREFADLLRANARDRVWGFPGRVDIRFEASEQVKSGRFEVSSEHRSDEASPDQDRPKASLRTTDSSATWELKPQNVIGREDGCEVLIDDGEVSRKHASVESKDDGWWVSDLGSTNHTFVNGTVTKERRLQTGDILKVGNTELVFEEGS